MTLISSKKKILFVITKSNFGGAQKYVHDLATSLPKERFDVAVILGGNGTLVDKLQTASVRTIPLSSLGRDINASQDLASFFTLLKIFRAEKPDIIHLNSAKVSGLGALAGRIAGVPNIVFTAHGWAFNEDRSWLARIIIKFLSWTTVLLSHKTIAVSDAIARDMRCPGAAQKITVIKNGVQPFSMLSREQAREALNEISSTVTPEDAFTIGTIAELHPSKGLAYAIEAFAEIARNNPNIYYVIIGAGQEQKRLANLVKTKDLGGRVMLLGFVNNAAQYLKAFDCFVLPSITEALGYVLLEAGLAGIPVVATNVGGIPEIIEDEKTGLLVASRDPEALALALHRLISSPTLRSSLGATLNNTVLRDFSAENMVSKTIALYEKK